MHAPQCYVVSKLPLLLWTYKGLGVIYYLHLTLKEEAHFSETSLSSCQNTRHTTANGILRVFRSLSQRRFIQVRVPCGVSFAGFYVIYLQHKGKVVHSQAMKAHGAAEVQLPTFLLSAPSRFDAGAHWREGSIVPGARVGVL